MQTVSRGMRRVIAGGRRVGTIVFMEFMATLPIFTLLLISATAFHLYYKHTRQAYGEARLGVWIRMDEHITKGKGANLLVNYTPQGAKKDKDLHAGTNPTTQHFDVFHNLAISKRNVNAPRWLGASEAVGRYEGGRDCWGHFDIEDRQGTDGPGGQAPKNEAPSMPSLFGEPSAGGEPTKSFLKL